MNYMIKDTTFNGLVLEQCYALLDTGAQYGVSGTVAIAKLEREIQSCKDDKGQPLKCTRVEGPTSTVGTGGAAKVKFCSLAPYGLGYDISGILLMLILDDGN
jgi:hypothetical protein